MPDRLSVDYHLIARLSQELAQARAMIASYVECDDVAEDEKYRAEGLCKSLKSSEEVLDDTLSDESCHIYEM